MLLTAKRGVLGAWLTAVAMLFILVGLTVLPPFLSEEMRKMVMELFAPVCHQMPGRSFSYQTIPLAVCHRCTGIYSGLAAASLIYPYTRVYHKWLWRNSQWMLLLVVAPMTADWMGALMGWWPNTVSSRLLTGGIFGLGAGYYVTTGLVQGAAYISNRLSVRFR